MMTCFNCKFTTYIRHSVPWHKGLTCEQYDLQIHKEQTERWAQEAATVDLLATTSIVCPKCGNGVTKSVGCDHIRCTSWFSYEAQRHSICLANSRQVAVVQSGAIYALRIGSPFKQRERIIISRYAPIIPRESRSQWAKDLPKRDWPEWEKLFVATKVRRHAHQ